MAFRSGIIEREITVGRRGRIYLVHVPNREDLETPRPLLVVLHGGGGSAAFASRVYGWRELSQRHGCLIVFPEAECEDPSRPAAVRENPRVWNDGSTRSAVARRNVDDIGYLNAVLDDVQRHFAVDHRRVYVTGFSSGGSMTFRVGVEMADRVTAIAPVAGHLCIADPQPVRPVSMLYIIGLEDPLNPFDGGPVLSPWGARRQRPPVMKSIRIWIELIDADEVPHVIRHDNGVHSVRYGPGPGGQQVQLCTIAGQGHEWPGARRTLPQSISGPQTDKICATTAVWEFFSQVSLTI